MEDLMPQKMKGRMRQFFLDNKGNFYFFLIFAGIFFYQLFLIVGGLLCGKPWSAKVAAKKWKKNQRLVVDIVSCPFAPFVLKKPSVNTQGRTKNLSRPPFWRQRRKAMNNCPCPFCFLVRMIWRLFKWNAPNAISTLRREKIWFVITESATPNEKKEGS